MARRLPSTTSWLRWLTPGLQIKRWLVLLMVSELVLVLGVAYALKELYQTAHLPGFFFYLTLQFLPYWARAIIFGIFGVGLLLVSYLKLTQSILGPFLPGNSTSSVLEVIHAYRLRGRGPRVVAIGGGTGLSMLLRGLKTYTSNLTAIVTVADDGGSTGRLRQEFGVIAPGDIRQCIAALAEAEPLMSRLFQYRFREGTGLEGHSFGHLFVCNVATQHGETDGFCVKDHLDAIERHTGPGVIDAVVANSNLAKSLPQEWQSNPVPLNRDGGHTIPGIHVVEADVVAEHNR